MKAGRAITATIANKQRQPETATIYRIGKRGRKNDLKSSQQLFSQPPHQTLLSDPFSENGQQCSQMFVDE